MGTGTSRGVILGLGAALLAGCRAPPADLAACSPTAGSRTAILTRQVAADTVVGAASRPGRVAAFLVTEPPAYLRAWTAGLLGKRLGPRLTGPPGPVCPGDPLDPAGLEADLVRRSGGSPPAPAELALHPDGDTALAAVDRVIDGATCRLDVLMYIWGDDPVGWHVARRLADRAGPGLPVRVLVDGGGNLAQEEPHEARASAVNRAVCWLARQPHVHLVRTRNPALRFDHRKLVVADGRVVWGGGRNFSQDSFEINRDLSYTVAGPPAAELAAAFEAFWRDQGGPPGPDPQPVPAEAPNVAARVVRTDPARRDLAAAVYAAVERAGEHVYAENPYLGDGRFVRLLVAARRRGVDVRVVLPTDSGNGLFDRANRVTANRLLAAGVRVYLHPGRTHAKVLAVDGVWAYTGSGNFDGLSLRHNHEIGLTLSGGPAVGEVERVFLAPALDPAREVTAPLPVSPTDRLAELIAAAFG